MFTTKFVLIADEILDVSRKRFLGLNNVQHRIIDYTKELPKDDFDTVISALLLRPSQLDLQRT